MASVEVEADHTDETALGRVRHALLGAGVLAALAGALWFLGGGYGLVVAGAVAVVWLVSSPVYAYAVGQLLFVLLVIDGHGLVGSEPLIGLVDIEPLIGQLALALVLVSQFVSRRLSATLLAVATFAVAGGGVVAIAAVEPLWLAAVGLALAYGLVAYGIHRYELVTLGLVEEGSA